MGAQGKEVRARPGPFTTDHMLPWHPTTASTTTQPFPTLVLFRQTAPNTPPFLQLATQTWQNPWCLLMTRPGKAQKTAPTCATSNPCGMQQCLTGLDWEFGKITPLKESPALVQMPRWNPSPCRDLKVVWMWHLVASAVQGMVGFNGLRGLFQSQ